MNKALTVFSVLLVTVAFVAGSALAIQPPVITLETVEVASIQPFFVKPKVEVPDPKDPTKKIEKVETFGYSSTLSTAYIFNIKNPNKEALMLDELSFTITFDGFEVNTVTVYDDMWIPGGKTNQVRVTATNEAFPLIVSLGLGVDNVKRLQERKLSGGAVVGKWWSTIGDFAFPIEIKNGSAIFVPEKGKPLTVFFKGKFGGAPAEKK